MGDGKSTHGQDLRQNWSASDKAGEDRLEISVNPITALGLWKTKKDMPTEAVQDYLKAIHSLGGVETMVSPVDISARP